MILSAQAPANVDSQPADNKRITAWDLHTGLISVVAVVPFLAPSMVVRAAAFWLSAAIWIGAVGPCIWQMRYPESEQPMRKRSAILLQTISVILYGYVWWTSSLVVAYVAVLGLFSSWVLGRLPKVAVWKVVVLDVLLACSFTFRDDWVSERISYFSLHFTSTILDFVGIANRATRFGLETEFNYVFRSGIEGLVGTSLLLVIAILLSAFRRRSIVQVVLQGCLCPVWVVLAQSLAIFLSVWTSRNLLGGANAGSYMIYAQLGSAALAVMCIVLSDVFFERLLRPSSVTEPSFAPAFDFWNTVVTYPNTLPSEYRRRACLGEDVLGSREEGRERSSEPERFVWSTTKWWRLLVWSCSVALLILAVPCAATQFGVFKHCLTVVSQQKQLSRVVSGLKHPELIPPWEEVTGSSIHVGKTWKSNWRGKLLTATLEFPVTRATVLDPSDRFDEKLTETRLVDKDEFSEWNAVCSQLTNRLGRKKYVLSCSFDFGLDPVASLGVDRSSEKELTPRGIGASAHEVVALYFQCGTGGDLDIGQLRELEVAFHQFRVQLRSILKAEYRRSDETHAPAQLALEGQ